MLSEKRIFGGLNKVSDERSLKQGDYQDALNFRIGGSYGNDVGVGTNIKGNTLISYALPSGVNRCIGVYEDKTFQFIYYFIWNSLARHRLLRYNFITQAVELVLKDEPGNAILLFDRKHKITGVGVYHADENNHLLYWTDDNTSPRKINVQKAIRTYAGGTDTYPLPMKREYTELIKFAPLYPPVCNIYNDPVKGYNYLSRSTFQFAYSYVNDDSEETKFSPYSTLVFAGDNNNAISIQVKTGTALVKKIKLYGRSGNTGDWFLIETLNKERLSIASNTSYTYTYFNHRLSYFVDQRFARSPFDKVPLKAKALTVIEGDRLVLGNIVEEYDNVNVINAARRSSNAVVEYTTTNLPDSSIQPLNTNIYQTVKQYDQLDFGIQYIDEAGRFGAVNTGLSYSLTISPERVLGAPGYVSTVTVRIDSTIRPPDWAKSYAVVRTKNALYSKYLQFVVNDVVFTDDTGAVTSFGNCTRIKLDFSNITKYSLENNALLAYDFVPGDRVRLIRTHGNHVPAQDVDLPILTQDGDFVIVKKSSTYGSMMNFAAGDLFELYTPRLSTDTRLFYEIHTFYDILNPGKPERAHAGDVNQSYGNTDAVLFIYTFDTFYRVREMSIKTGKVQQWVESESASDFFESRVSDIGRANIVSLDIKQQRRPYTIYYSERFIADTFVNGLSSFYDDNFERYSDYGSIQKLFYHNKRLKVFQENKVGEIMVNERIVYDNSGQSLIATSEKVLNNIQYYAAEFGISLNPESIAFYGNSIYFTDARRGAVLRLASNGIFPISDYGMHRYFMDTFSALSLSASVAVYGVYHADFKEYIVAFAAEDTLLDVPINDTLAFNEEMNRWVTRYSFRPEYLCTNGTGLVSFKEGQLYTHDTSSIFNNFYGLQYSSQVTVVFNEFPSQIKTYLITSTEGSAWDYMISTLDNQVSELKDFDFEEIKGEWRAAFFRDINSEGGLLEGDDLQGQWLKVQLENTSASLVRLYAVNVGFVNSDFTRK